MDFGPPKVKKEKEFQLTMFYCKFLGEIGLCLLSDYQILTESTHDAELLIDLYESERIYKFTREMYY